MCFGSTSTTTVEYPEMSETEKRLWGMAEGYIEALLNERYNVTETKEIVNYEDAKEGEPGAVQIAGKWMKPVYETKFTYQKKESAEIENLKKELKSLTNLSIEEINNLSRSELEVLANARPNRRRQTNRDDKR
jgi:hypothetical protein